MQRLKFIYLTNVTDEFDYCTCNHKKIHHGGIHKITNYYGLEEIVQFGCIECEYEYSDTVYPLRPQFTYHKNRMCKSFIPAILK